MPLFPPQGYRNTENTHRYGLAVDKPAAADVLKGTYYYSFDTGDFERSNGTTWDPILSGGVGPTGPAGINGVPGQDGNDGIDGYDGINGISGAQGLVGPAGIKGDAGIPGLDGEDGESSFIPGPRGNDGAGSGINGGVFTFSFGDAGGFNPADGITYRIGYQAGFDPATVDNLPFIAPKGGIVKACYGRFAILGTLGTAGQNSTLSVQNITAVTNEVISSTVSMDATPTRFNNAAMTLAFSAGDELDISWLTPTWTTNPTVIFGNIMMYVEFS